MTRSYSAALPIARVFLKLLIVLNWLVGAATIVLLLAMPNREWIIERLRARAVARCERVIMGLAGDRRDRPADAPALPSDPHPAARDGRRRCGPAIPSSSPMPPRLQQIAWAMIGLQLAGLVISLIVRAISTPAHPVEHRRRAFDQRPARHPARLRAGPGVRGRRADARGSGRDGLTWRSRSSSTICSTRGA